MSITYPVTSDIHFFRFLAALALLTSLATGCAGADNPCRSLVVNNSQGYFILGRVTSDRISFGEYSGMYYQADGLDGVSVWAVDHPGAAVVTNTLGCFALPVKDPTPSIVIATLRDGQFLAATRAMFLSDDRADGMSSRFLEISLAAQGLVRFTPKVLDQEYTYFSLERVIAGESLSIALKASAMGDNTWAFAGIGPGYYRLAARLPSGTKIYYPHRSSREDAEILAVGLEPVELGSWDMREIQ